MWTEVSGTHKTPPLEGPFNFIQIEKEIFLVVKYLCFCHFHWYQYSKHKRTRASYDIHFLFISHFVVIVFYCLLMWQQAERCGGIKYCSAPRVPFLFPPVLNSIWKQHRKHQLCKWYQQASIVQVISANINCASDVSKHQLCKRYQQTSTVQVISANINCANDISKHQLSKWCQKTSTEQVMSANINCARCLPGPGKRKWSRVEEEERNLGKEGPEDEEERDSHAPEGQLI